MKSYTPTRPVKECNSRENAVSPVLYDSIRETSKPSCLRLSFYRPEVGLELKISENLTLFNSMGINISGNFLRGAETFINHDYSGELRIYYNRENRLKKGFDIYNFSGPFIAGTYKYFIENNIENRHAVGILHGWQKNNLFRSLYSNIRLGLAYDVDRGDILIMSFINMGWVF